VEGKGQAMGMKQKKGFASFNEAFNAGGTAYRAYLSGGPKRCCPVRLDEATAIEDATALGSKFGSAGGKAAVMRVQKIGIAWKTKVVWP
jgi:hypothetical protein